jgi:Tol biopolymer transport system component
MSFSWKQQDKFVKSGPEPGPAHARRPDGSQLVFARVESGVFHLYKVGADGSGVTRLSTENDATPNWSRNF